MYLNAYRPRVPEIQRGRRTDSDNEEDEDEDDPWHHLERPWFIGLISWDQTDPRTWPENLREFWWDIETPDDARRIASAILQAYPDDRHLGLLVDWLRFWADLGAHFKCTYE